MLETQHIEIELTTNCTLGCPACPRNDPKVSKKEWDVGHIDTDLVIDLINQEAEKTGKKLMFVGCYGDPLYHPDFIKIYNHASEKQIETLVHTNGSFKTKAWWDKLVRTTNWSRAQTWEFSVDGLEDTNHLYRINSKWDSIMLGMKSLAEMLNSREWEHEPGKPYPNKPRIIWKYLVFPYNQHQIQEAEQLAHSYGFEFHPVKSERDIASYKVDNNHIYDWNGKGADWYHWQGEPT